MQQLNVVLEDGKIYLDITPALELENFRDMVTELCQQINAQIMDISLGADRQQLHFRFQQGDFLLCAEQLCEAIWIESLGPQPPALTEYLYECLTNC